MTDPRDRTGATANNPDIQAMHRELIALVRRLEESIDFAPTAGAIGAIADQIAEVNARVTSTGRVLLARQTEEIARHARSVTEALPEIEDEIASLQRLEHVVRSITAVLGTVDEAVRVATLVCR